MNVNLSHYMSNLISFNFNFKEIYHLRELNSKPVVVKLIIRTESRFNKI